MAYLRHKILELKKVIQKEYHCEKFEIFEQKAFTKGSYKRHLFKKILFYNIYFSHNETDIGFFKKTVKISHVILSTLIGSLSKIKMRKKEYY